MAWNTNSLVGHRKGWSLSCTEASSSLSVYLSTLSLKSWVSFCNTLYEASPCAYSTFIGQMQVSVCYCREHLRTFPYCRLFAFDALLAQHASVLYALLTFVPAICILHPADIYISSTNTTKCTVCLKSTTSKKVHVTSMKALRPCEYRNSFNKLTNDVSIIAHAKQQRSRHKNDAHSIKKWFTRLMRKRVVFSVLLLFWVCLAERYRRYCGLYRRQCECWSDASSSYLVNSVTYRRLLVSL